MIQPICDRVCIKPLDTGEITTKTGIIIPDRKRDSDREFTRRGFVIAVGQHTDCPNCGYRAWPLEVKVGDIALYTNKYIGREFTDEDDTKYLIMREIDIIAIEI